MTAVVRAMPVRPSPAVAAPESEPCRYLHLHQQEFPHDEARIAANREGLKKLREAIDVLLAMSPSDRDILRVGHFFASDGEGFDVVLELHSDTSFLQQLVSYSYGRESDA